MRNSRTRATWVTWGWVILLLGCATLPAEKGVRLPDQPQTNDLREIAEHVLKGKDGTRVLSLLDYQPDSLRHEAVLLKAVIFYRLGQLDTAQKILEGEVRLQPDHPYIHNLLGVIFLRQGQGYIAQEHFEKAVQLDLNEAKPNLALTYMISDNQDALRRLRLETHSVSSRTELSVFTKAVSARCSGRVRHTRELLQTLPQGDRIAPYFDLNPRTSRRTRR